jgi:integrase
MLASSPVVRAEAPVAVESDGGTVLDEESLLRLVKGFRPFSLFPIVALAAFAGMRRNEILGLRWSDLDVAARTITVARSLEETERYGLAFKEPKTARGRRTIEIDEELVAVLLAERDKHLRIAAAVLHGAIVDLLLVHLPHDALMFPSPPASGHPFSFTRPRACRRRPLRS